jgi:hypothetical protein
MRIIAMFPKDFQMIWIVVMSPKVGIMQMATVHPMKFSSQIIQMAQLKMTYHLRPRVISKGKPPGGKIFMPSLRKNRRRTITKS